MSRPTMTGFAVMIGAVCFIVGIAGCGGGSDAVRPMQSVDFTMAWDSETQSMAVVDQVGPAYVQVGGVRLYSSDVVWNSGTKELSGVVTICNHGPGSMRNVVADVLSYDPSDQNISDDGMWSYTPTVLPNVGAQSDPRTWTFTNPNTVSFQFTVRIFWD